MKKYQINVVCTANDLRNHKWLQDPSDQIGPNGENPIKKKKSQFNLHNDGNMSVILSLKELLNVSSDWLDVKKPLHGGTGGGPSSGSTSVGTNQGSVPADFQSTQIERIIDNLCLAMPTRGAQNI